MVISTIVYLQIGRCEREAGKICERGTSLSVPFYLVLTFELCHCSMYQKTIIKSTRMKVP